MRQRFFISICALVALTISLAPFASRADVLGALKGTVVNSSGAAVAGARITLEAPDESPQSTTSDQSGAFVFARVPFDTYTITAAASGYSNASSIVTVASGSVAVARLVLGAPILGHVAVRGTSGQIAGVNVVNNNLITTLPGNTSLNKIIETVPGIVPFSYNEPVARGYHGLTYEIDGVPMPQTTTSAFSELIDPRDVDRMEVFTGSIPAEFGGDRMGAVVDIVSLRPSATAGDQALFTEAAGSYASASGTFNEFVNSDRLSFFASANSERTSRGLDSPTFVPNHDDSNNSNEFLRLTEAPDARETISFDFSNQFSGFQIPIDTNPNDPLDPQFSVPGTDDNQYEYYRTANIVFNRTSADGQGYVEIAPWYRLNRVVYTPDPGHDLLNGPSSSATSVSQDRQGQYAGLTASLFRTTAKHNFKVGFTADEENFKSSFQILSNTQPPFLDNANKNGSTLGVYAEDQYAASSSVQVNYGVRYDRSVGFTSGNQVSPRIEIDDKVNPNDTVHVYYGRLYAAPSLEDVRAAANIFGGTSATPPPTLPVYDLKPETDSIYEAGIAHRFSDETTGSVNFWGRDVWNVLDTTQLGSTPIFTVFNSAQGQAEGVELRLQGQHNVFDSWYLSYGLSQSLAEGISGGLFLFPTSVLLGANTFQPEDHDQTNTLDGAYTWGYGSTGRGYTTIQTNYGSGYPVQFLNGPSRLPAHVTFGAAIGLKAPPSGGGFGWEIQGTNLLNKQYLLKESNGFNTTQWVAGRQVTLTLSEAIR